MRCLITLLIIGFLLTGIPASAHAQESAGGTISGQVINDTQGGGSVSGIEITLLTYVDDVLADSAATIADDEGKFQFDDINPEYEYLIAARYMDVDYYYPVEFETGAVTAYVEVGVCDTTGSDALIRSGLTHKIVEIEEETIKITEVHWLVNDGDKTYLREDGVLDFSLPEGAFGFQAPEELVIDFQLREGDMVTYLVPFPPGERQLIYAYSLPKPDAAEFTVPLAIDYPTDSLEVMIGGEDIEAAVTQLAPAEPVVSDTGISYLHFQGENLPHNTVVNLRLADLSQSDGFPLYILWIIIAIVVVGVVLYLIRRGKRADTDERR
jgi:hypothetical protein